MGGGKPCEFMRRLALIFGLALTLTAGMWSSALAAAAAWCAHEADAAAAASDEHDCCRAKIGEPDAHHSASPQTSHDAAHKPSTTHGQAGATRAATDCGGAESSSTTEITVASLGGRSCVECCAGVPGKTPAPAVFVTPEQGKVKRDAGDNCASASDLFASVTLDVSHLAPSQHAPPAPPGRRHILISVFLI